MECPNQLPGQSWNMLSYGTGSFVSSFFPLDPVFSVSHPTYPKVRWGESLPTLSQRGEVGWVIEDPAGSIAVRNTFSDFNHSTGAFALARTILLGKFPAEDFTCKLQSMRFRGNIYRPVFNGSHQIT